MQKSLALFDFDGTLINGDSMMAFVKFCRGWIGFWLGLLILSPHFLFYFFRLISNVQLKEKFLKWFLSNYNVDDLDERAKQFTDNRIPSMLRKEAIQRLEWHKSRGDRIIVVSSSADLWLKPWCNLNQVELISTRLEIINGKFTGKIDGGNCYGKNKETRIKENILLNEYKQIFVYGDSKGDQEMLSLAHKKFYKSFTG